MSISISSLLGNDYSFLTIHSYRTTAPTYLLGKASEINIDCESRITLQIQTSNTPLLMRFTNDVQSITTSLYDT